MSRLERFRTPLRKLDATDPEAALANDWIVQHGSYTVSSQIAQDMELSPGGMSLLLGGVGTGKSTQLLLVGQQVATQGKIVLKTQIRGDYKFNVDGLFSSIVSGKILDHLENKSLTKGSKYEDFEQACRDYISQCGNDFPLSVRQILSLQICMKNALEEASVNPAELVILFDGLERLGQADRFDKIVEEASLLQEIGFSLLIVGSLELGFSKPAHLFQNFGRTFFQDALDVRNDPEARAFLEMILRKRVDESMIPGSVAQQIVDASGGVVRDLLHLARLSISNAYGDGSNDVRGAHVEAAIQEFSRTMLLGSSNEDLEVLRQTAGGAAFVPAGSQALRLLEHRLVLVYHRGAGHESFQVHPALAPLLGKKAA